MSRYSFVSWPDRRQHSEQVELEEWQDALDHAVRLARLWKANVGMWELCPDGTSLSHEPEDITYLEDVED